jgi:hypothetical protein
LRSLADVGGSGQTAVLPIDSQMSIRVRLLTASAAAALVVPAVAIGKPAQPSGNGQNPIVTYVFKGTVASTGSEQGSGSGQNSGGSVGFDRASSRRASGANTAPASIQALLSVQVNHGNAFVRQGGMVGTTVQFTITNAKITVADKNQDGVRNASDVLVGDKVLVQAPLRQVGPGPQPFAARHLVDQTH